MEIAPTLNFRSVSLTYTIEPKIQKCKEFLLYISESRPSVLKDIVRIINISNKSQKRK